MSVSPNPSRRNNNLNGRSPSPAVNAAAFNMIHNQPTSTSATDNFLSPDNTNLTRSRRSTPTDSTLKGNPIVSESIPLIKGENMDPPLANPEGDDSGDDREGVKGAYPDVDDGFFSNRLNPDGPTIPDTEAGKPADPGLVDDATSGATPRFPMSPTFPNGPSNKPLFPDLEFGTTDLESIPDINVYQHKKTLAQGMMDLALFSANANQLRYVLESDKHAYYYPGIVLISFSLLFQVAVGVGLIWNSRYNVKDAKEICIANKINNFTIVGIFLITVVNVFISSFGVSQPSNST